MDAATGSWLEIDLGAIDRNAAAFGRAAGEGVGLCAVVKADAYGLGATTVARRLDARGVELLAVFSLDEAREIAAAGVATPLLVLSPVFALSRTDPLYRAAVAGRLQLTVHSTAQLDAVEAVGRAFGAPIPIHLEIDSGMSRGGMSVEEADALLPRIDSTRYLTLAGLFTHPASAELSITATNRQLHMLNQLIERHAASIPPRTRVHFANTYAALRDRKFHRSMLRVGLGLFGYGPEGVRGSRSGGVGALEPSVRWLGRVIHLRDVPAGQPVGYGGRYQTRRDSRLAIVPVGYADGYPLAMSNRAMVRVGEGLRPAPVRGAVNMDQLIIDVTGMAEVGRGTGVEIYASDPEAPNCIPNLADLAETSVYELLCRLSPRLTRHYVSSAAGRGRAAHHVATAAGIGA